MCQNAAQNKEQPPSRTLTIPATTPHRLSAHVRVSSDTCYYFTFTFSFPTDVDDDMMTWEGKEGRMFVYELLCKHLIEFHTDQTCVSSQRNVCSQDGGRYAPGLDVLTISQAYLSALVLSEVLS